MSYILNICSDRSCFLFPLFSLSPSPAPDDYLYSTLCLPRRVFLQQTEKEGEDEGKIWKTIITFILPAHF